MQTHLVYFETLPSKRVAKRATKNLIIISSIVGLVCFKKKLKLWFMAIRFK